MYLRTVDGSIYAPHDWFYIDPNTFIVLVYFQQPHFTTLPMLPMFVSLCLIFTINVYKYASTAIETVVWAEYGYAIALFSLVKKHRQIWTMNLSRLLLYLCENMNEEELNMDKNGVKAETTQSFWMWSIYVRHMISIHLWCESVNLFMNQWYSD